MLAELESETVAHMIMMMRKGAAGAAAGADQVQLVDEDDEFDRREGGADGSFANQLANAVYSTMLMRDANLLELDRQVQSPPADGSPTV